MKERAGLNIGVLALQGDFAEHRAALGALGVNSAPIRTEAELAQVDALIIPGGESSAMDTLLERTGLREPIRERIAGQLPVYGSCAGMVLLADTLLDPVHYADGRVQSTLGGIAMSVQRNAFGRQVDSFERRIRFAGLESEDQDGEIEAVFIRAPVAQEVSGQAEILARVPAPIKAGATAHDRIVAVRQGPLLATAFHPEVTGDLRVHDFFIRMITGEQ